MSLHPIELGFVLVVALVVLGAGARGVMNAVSVEQSAKALIATMVVLLLMLMAISSTFNDGAELAYLTELVTAPDANEDPPMSDAAPIQSTTSRELQDHEWDA
jgi:hypothetical protein